MPYLWEKSVVRDVATRSLSAHPPAPVAPPVSGVTVAHVRALHRALHDLVASVSGLDGAAKVALPEGVRAAVAALAKA